MKSHIKIFFAAALLLLLPMILRSDYYVNIASQILIFALLALSLNLLIGFGGMTSLGHAVYVGITAYACALLSTRYGWAAVPSALVSVMVGTAAAAGFGILALRVSGLGFLMITLAFGQIVWGISYRWVALTNGDNGMRLEGRPSPFGFNLAAADSFFIFTALIFTICIYLIWRLANSAFGASLQGVRDQPRRMNMLGHNVWLFRWIAFVLAGFFASIAGWLYVQYNQFISPHAVSLQQSAEVLLMVILGGATALTGPIVGAIVITLVKNVLSSYTDRWYSVLGLIFVVVVVFMPQGIVPGIAALRRVMFGNRTGSHRQGD